MNKGKCLTPYYKLDDSYARYSLDNVCIGLVYELVSNEWSHTYIGDKFNQKYHDRRIFNTMESAMTSMDKMLVNNDYILLTEEQVLLI
jgi:hypothetical protein